MKKNELTKIKALDLKELTQKIKRVKGEIASLVMDKNMKKLKDIKMVIKKRRDLAQILTIMRQRQMLEELESESQMSQRSQK